MFFLKNKTIELLIKSDTKIFITHDKKIITITKGVNKMRKLHDNHDTPLLKN